MTTVHEPIPISVFEKRDGAPLSKIIRLSPTGGITKTSSAALADGWVEQREFTSLRELMDFLCCLRPNQAVSFGICEHKRARILSKKQFGRAEHNGDPIVCRDRDHFRWNDGCGVLFLDYDPPSGGAVLSPEELVQALRDAVPELHGVTIAHKPSASSFIHASDGRQLQGLTGQHIFLLVERALEIPGLGKRITDRLWLAGLGHVHVMANGRLLDRSLFDQSVWQPERLVFGTAACTDGLEQRASQPKVFPGYCDDLIGSDCWLSAGSLEDLSEKQAADVIALKTEARKGQGAAGDEARNRWLDERAAEIAGRDGCHGTRGEIRARLERDLAEDVLPNELVLTCDNGDRVTVGDILASPDEWHGARFADPVEPSYRDDNRIAIARLKASGRPHIYSHAHGGIRHCLPPGASQSATASDFPDLSRELAGATARARFTVIPAAEFANGRPLDWLMKRVLPTSALAMVYGPSGSGKSFFVLDMCWAVALGRRWAGRSVRQGRVVYVVAEGATGFRGRLRAFESYYDISLEGVPIGVIEDTPDLRKDDYRALIAQIEEAGGADLIIIDTLAQSTPGADENSGEDMGAAIVTCNEIVRQTGGVVLLVHHCGKEPSRGARGWSGIKGALDTEIMIRNENGFRVAVLTKQKDGEAGAEFPFTLTQVCLGRDEDGDPLSSCVVMHLADVPARQPALTGRWQKLVYQIVCDLAPFGPMTRDMIVDAALAQTDVAGEQVPPGPRDRDSISRALSTMIKRGLVVQTNDEIGLPQSHNSSQSVGCENSILTPPAPHLPLGGVVGGEELVVRLEEYDHDSLFSAA